MKNKMEKIERNEKDDAQKTKLIFLSLAALAFILLIWSFASANKARSERNALKQEMETVKQDNAKMEQMVKDLNQENDTLKKKVQELDASLKAKAAPKKTAKSSKASSKKSSKKTRRR